MHPDDEAGVKEGLAEDDEELMRESRAADRAAKAEVEPPRPPRKTARERFAGFRARREEKANVRHVRRLQRRKIRAENLGSRAQVQEAKARGYRARASISNSRTAIKRNRSVPGFFESYGRNLLRGPESPRKSGGKFPRGFQVNVKFPKR